MRPDQLQQIRETQAKAVRIFVAFPASLIVYGLLLFMVESELTVSGGLLGLALMGMAGVYPRLSVWKQFTEDNDARLASFPNPVG